jgi:O-antigen/teichoic acid export membrane protein
VHIPLAAISTVLGAMLIASDRQGRYAVYALVGAVANPILTIVFIKATLRWWDDGAIGAAAVTVATEFFMVYGAYRLRRRGVFDRATAAFALRCLAACAFMATPLVVFDGWNIFLKVAVGIVVYIAAAIGLRVISPDEIKTLPGKLRGARRYVPEPATAAANDVATLDDR